MPLYTAITEDGFVSDETKAKIAREITRIHTAVMKVPNNFVRVVFSLISQGFGIYGGRRGSHRSIELCPAEWPH